MFTVTESWSHIDDWLRKHAPITYELLAPPADPAELERVQDEMELRFPQDLVDSLRCHDGLLDNSEVYVLPELYPLLSVAQILQLWQEIMQVNNDLGDQSDREDPWYHRLWIPIASVDSDSQILDVRDGSGRLGMHYHDQGAVFGKSPWTSLRGYLSATAEALLNNTDVQGRFPHLDDEGEVLWVDLDNTEGWGSPLQRLPAEVSS
ncbi:SMI1/KNR4 family protein [Lentzea tibetensis]|nr:SMI1/KNR4 family protein [Lentzea tibetensis]